MADDFLKMLIANIQKSADESGHPVVSETYEKREEMVMMRDGVRLQTKIYLPKMTQQTYPVILQRTCYPHMELVAAAQAEAFVKRGYVFVYQFCRGIAKSEGTWEPNVHERNDGIDTVKWLHDQPWAGRIGVWGMSYGALIGWAMADEVEAYVTSMYLRVYGTDRFTSAYQKGAFRHDILTSWTMENAGFPIATDYIESCKYMPQIQVDEDLWGQKIEWYREYILNDRFEDAYWHQGFWEILREVPGKTKIPLYITSGWYDHHHGSSMITWNRLNEEAKKHSWLEIGGWNHFGGNCLEHQTVEQNKRDEIKDAFTWFHMTLVEGIVPKGKVHLYEIGKDAWWEYESLDEIMIEETDYYLSAKEGQKTLEVEQPAEPSEVIYQYDPKYPVMTHGAESVLRTMKEVGSQVQPEADYRSDVISFVSEPLTEELPLWGKIKVQLCVSTDCEDTAFTAKLMEIHEDNTACNIRSSITTIGAETDSYTPGTPVMVEVEMWEIMYTFRKGSRIRLDISSSDFPQYNIHSNYAGKWALQDKTKVADQHVLCGPQQTSKLILPVRK